MTRLVTWNMQGSSAASEAKWFTTVENNFFGRFQADIVCLQECGTCEAITDLIRLQTFPGPPVYTLYMLLLCKHKYTCLHDYGTCNYYLGTGVCPYGPPRIPPKYIFFCYWDIKGNRCNMALVSTVKPEDLYLSPEDSVVWRPIFGVQIRGNWYFCLHGISPGGSDIRSLVSLAENCAKPSFLSHPYWYVAGDFNQAPPASGMGQYHVWTPGVPTHSGGGCYDYLYTNDTNRYKVCVFKGDIKSDHIPVMFTFT